MHARRSPPRRGPPRPKPAHQRVPAQPPGAAPRRRWGPARRRRRRPPLLPHAQQKKASPPSPGRPDSSRSSPAGTSAPSALLPQLSRGSQLLPQTELQLGRHHARCRTAPPPHAIAAPRRPSREREGRRQQIRWWENRIRPQPAGFTPMWLLPAARPWPQTPSRPGAGGPHRPIRPAVAFLAGRRASGGPLGRRRGRGEAAAGSWSGGA